MKIPIEKIHDETNSDYERYYREGYNQAIQDVRKINKTVWIAVNKTTREPVMVKECMEDLPFNNNWLIEVEIELPTS